MGQLSAYRFPESSGGFQKQSLKYTGNSTGSDRKDRTLTFEFEPEIVILQYGNIRVTNYEYSSAKTCIITKYNNISTVTKMEYNESSGVYVFGIGLLKYELVGKNLTLKMNPLILNFTYYANNLRIGFDDAFSFQFNTLGETYTAIAYA